MGILGVAALTFGVDDMETADRFWSDFGLKKANGASEALVFETRNGGQVVVKSADDPSLPPALIQGPTAREVTWGVESDADLEAIAEELGKNREVTTGDDGTVRSTDPCGYGIAFRAASFSSVDPTDQGFNTPGRADRVDERGKIYTDAQPQYLSHVVFKVPNLEETRSFYTDRLGFKLTDSYPGQGYFLRGSASQDHHNLFLLNVGEEKGFHHVAFEVRDIHELFGGGLNMSSKGWETHLGPGRHPISSCYFWYFKNPCGGAAEYDWDSDHVTDQWEPREWPRVPDAFAEWALETGMQLYGGVQTGSV